MEIRVPSIEDLESVKELTASVFFPNLSYEEASKNFSNAGSELKEFLSSKENIFLVAEKDGKLVGYIHGKKAPPPVDGNKYFQLTEIGVVPNERGKGIGKKLIKEFTKVVSKMGYSKISLICASKNKEALEFYKHLGYHETDIYMEKHI